MGQKKELGIYFGAISDAIGVQLSQQGFKYDQKVVEQFEKDADALTRLRMRGLLTDSITDNINKKLFKKIERHVKMVNKLT